MISLIVAIAQNGAIGKNNDLLWHISDDLKRFKAITSGHTVVMGTKTYESLPFKPLPKRRNVIVSRNKNLKLEGCEVYHSIDEALQQLPATEEHFVIGGASIYEQTLPIADKLYVTWVYRDFDADAFFPTINLEQWQIAEQSATLHDEASGLDYAFFTYVRKG